MSSDLGSALVVAVDDPRAADVRALIETHFNISRDITPEGFSFALGADDLTGPGMSFFTARRDGVLLAMAALKRLDDTHAELKSMHTVAAARGQGIGRAVLEHILEFAAGHGFRRVSLETGTSTDYGPARALYRSAGFEACGPFGDYAASPHNTFMTLLDPHQARVRKRPG